MTRLTALIEAAKAATPGPWNAEPMAGRGAWIKGNGGRWTALSCGETDDEGAANATFIASCDPTTILALAEWAVKARELLSVFTASRRAQELINEDIVK